MMKAPKTIKRLWSSNLSGGQIGYIFSRCLRDTMRPLSVCPMLDERAGVFLSRLAQNSKKKDTYQFFFALKCLTDGLQTDNVEEKILLYEKANVNRGDWLVLFNEFEAATKGYVALYHEWMREVSPFKRNVLLRQVQQVAGKLQADPDALYLAVRDFGEALERLMQFKNDMLYQYTSLATSMVGRWAANQASYSLLDMHQIAMQAADEALNTFNANMGAPTSLIKQQMLFAMGHSSAMVNIAYSVPPAERKRIATRISASTNYAVSMDHPVGDSDQTIADKLAVIASDDNSEQSIFQSATVTFQRMIKTLDPKGVFRLAKGISEPHA